MKTSKTINEKVQTIFESWINSQERVTRMINSFKTNGHDGIHESGHEYEVGEDGIVRCKTNQGYEVPIGKHIQGESYVYHIRGRLRPEGDIKESLDKVYFGYSVSNPFGYGYVPHNSLFDLRGGNTVWQIWENYSESNGYDVSRNGEIQKGLQKALDSVYKNGKTPQEVLEDIRAHLLALAEAVDYANDREMRWFPPSLPERRFEYLTEKFRVKRR